MSKLVFIPLDFVKDCFKTALPKTLVDDAVGSSLLGLTTTVGAPLLGNAASGNTKADACGWRFRMPWEYVEGSDLVFRARCKIATTLSTVSNKVSGTATLMGDAGVGANLFKLGTTGQQVTIAYADYDFVVTGATIRPRDLLYGTLILTSIDTGGTVNTAMSCIALSVGVPMRLAY